MLILGAALAVLIGATLGLLGGGGSTLTLPLLVYVLRVEPRAAIATSLIVVGVTSVFALVPHVRARRVDWVIGTTVGLFGMAGAALGARVAHHLPPTLLLLGFALLMISTAARMLFGAAAPPRSRRAGHVTHASIGVCVGVLAGLFGAGGGFLIVPALVAFAGLAMREAIATSLLAIAMQAFAGFAAHAGHVNLDARLIVTITVATSVGALLGARAVGKVDVEVLRRGFGALLLSTGIAMTLMQIPRPLLHRPEVPVLALALAAAALAAFLGRARTR